MRAALFDVVNDGLDGVALLQPGHGFIDLTGGVTQDAAFGRLQAGEQITDAISVFGFAQAQKDFARQGVEFEAGAGLRARF